MSTTKKIALLALFFLVSPISTAMAENSYKPDDTVSIQLSAEDWVTTKSARVVVGVEAAVSEKTAGTMRADMTDAINKVVKADWRLVSFTRSQDNTGMERWSTIFEARVPEASLNGLNEQAKKQSKAGMQIQVVDIDFSPTLAETQDATNKLRTQIYKMATEQLGVLNQSVAGRSYRIGNIDFQGSGGTFSAQNMARSTKMMRAQASTMMEMAVSSDAMSAGGASMERAQKIVLTANIVYAAVPPVAAK
ncbi:MAG: hypothetical protein EOM37_00970 [Proteobacteria bacterium]|jgi:hypothetical protein|nr:hypothetical protein [Alphaproteobacteria bacterium]NCC02612.1 hypothetical protein [Pseudomonadota bacterium]